MLDRLRERTGAFLESVARDRCRYQLEDRPDVRIGERYLRATDLFGQEQIREVQRALAGASGEEEKRLRFLLEFLALGYSRCVAAGEMDRLRTWAAHATVTVRERTVPLRAVPALLRRISDRELRLELEEARLAAADEQLPVVEGWIAHQRDAVEELGYGSFLESCEILSGIDLRGLAREAERFLSDTDPAYRELLAWHLPRLAGVESDAAEASDAAALEGAAPYLEHFPDARILQRVLTALTDAGLDPLAAGHLRTATRPYLPSGEGAVCCALRVPEEVHLTVSDQPGRAVHASLLRGLGYALQRAHTAAELEVEERRLGDRSVPLGFGSLLEGLLSNPAFAERVCGVPRAALPEYLRLGALLSLLRARRDAALLQVELEAYAPVDPHEGAERYVERLGRATGLRHDPRGALLALRPPFRVARRLRAAQLGAALSRQLRERFDDDWWRNPRSGALLLDFFRSGQRYTAAELSVQLTSSPLSLDTLREQLEEAV
jgi:hypothetical protein